MNKMESGVLVAEERYHPGEACIPPIRQQLLILEVAQQRLILYHLLANCLENDIRFPKESFKKFERRELASWNLLLKVVRKDQLKAV